jgi:hypothetical protein
MYIYNVFVITVLANICDANAVMLMKLHVDSITMAAIRGRTRGGVVGVAGALQTSSVVAGHPG